MTTSYHGRAVLLVFWHRFVCFVQIDCTPGGIENRLSFPRGEQDEDACPDLGGGLFGCGFDSPWSRTRRGEGGRQSGRPHSDEHIRRDIRSGPAQLFLRPGRGEVGDRSRRSLLRGWFGGLDRILRFLVNLLRRDSTSVRLFRASFDFDDRRVPSR